MEHSYAVQPHTPSVTFGDTSPYTGEAYAPPGDLLGIRRILGFYILRLFV